MSSCITYDASQHPVHSVTVFQENRADITRRIEVELKKGQNEVEIRNLPSILEQDSIRVDGIGRAVIVDVIYKSPQPACVVEVSEGVKELHKHKAKLESELEVYTSQSSVLEGYAQTLKCQYTSSEALSSFLKVYADHKRDITQASTSLNEQIEAVKRQIGDAEQSSATDEESQKRGVRIVIVVLAEVNGPAELTLNYAVTNASWTPMYDLRADIGAADSKGVTNPTVSLQYKASIVQCTAENWSDVQLTLSTASPQIGSTIPKLEAKRLGEDTPVVYHPATKRSSLSFGGSGGGPTRSAGMPTMRSLRLGSFANDSLSMEASPQFFVQAQARATDHSQGFSSTFEIEGLSTIPSDTTTSNEKHKVTISMIQLENVELEWVAVPKEIANVFLRCKVKNTSEFTFLPGEANVFMNNNFVSKSNISNVSPHETFSCSLGVDSSIRITYHPQAKTLRQPLGSILTTKTITTSLSQRISVKNTRRQLVKRLVVRDQVPISSDERIKVLLNDPNLPEVTGNSPVAVKEVAVAGVHAKKVKARWAPKNEEEESSGEANGEGLIEWICCIEPDSSIDLSLNWDVTVPKGLNWKIL